LPTALRPQSVDGLAPGVLPSVLHRLSLARMTRSGEMAANDGGQSKEPHERGPQRPRSMRRIDSQLRTRVRPAFYNKNLLTFLNSGPIALAGRHAKVRREGYRSAGAAAAGRSSSTRTLDSG